MMYDCMFCLDVSCADYCFLFFDARLSHHIKIDLSWLDHALAEYNRRSRFSQECR